MKIKYFLLPIFLLSILLSSQLYAQEEAAAEEEVDYTVTYEELLENDTSFQFQNKMETVLLLNDSSTYRNFFLSAYTYNKSLEMLKNIDYKGVTVEELDQIQSKIAAYIKFSHEHFEKIEDHRTFRPLDQSVIGHYVNYSLSRNEKAEVYRKRLARAEEEGMMKKPIENL